MNTGTKQITRLLTMYKSIHAHEHTPTARSTLRSELRTPPPGGRATARIQANYSAPPPPRLAVVVDVLSKPADACFPSLLDCESGHCSMTYYHACGADVSGRGHRRAAVPRCTAASLAARPAAAPNHGQWARPTHVVAATYPQASCSWRVLRHGHCCSVCQRWCCHLRPCLRWWRRYGHRGGYCWYRY